MDRVQKTAISFLPSICILWLRPFGMSWNQSMVMAGLFLVLIWWSTGLVHKILASWVLLVIFLMFGQAPLRTVFSFPLSDNFWLIILCYLFSRGIENAHIAEKVMSPFLFRYVNTSIKMLLAIILFFCATMYVIPQPLARLIIIANMVRIHLRRTDASEEVQEVLLFAVFVFYVIVNMACLDADIILNTSAIGFAGLGLGNLQWLRYMLVPTILYGLLVTGVFVLIFRRQMVRVSFRPRQQEEREAFTGRERKVLAVVLATVGLWMTSGLHGINPTLITLAGTLCLFLLGDLKGKDLSAVDVTTLFFLTAAFCIGGVMKYTGIADIIFSKAGNLFPPQAGAGYVLAMILVTMGLHLILGSNTTTLSVVLPGLMTICEGMVSGPRILFIAYISLTAHFLLPFHAVAIMIGVSNRYFPAKFVAKFGIPMMAVIIAGIFGIYIPYWSWAGL